MQFQDLSYSYSNGFAIRAEGLTDRLMKQNWEPRYRPTSIYPADFWQGTYAITLKKNSFFSKGYWSKKSSIGKRKKN